MKVSLIILLIVIGLTYMSRNKIVKNVFGERLSENFTLGELLVTNKPFPNIPNDYQKKSLSTFAKMILQPVRDMLGVPVVVNSAFRSDQVNTAVGGVDNSQHRFLNGNGAADIVPRGMPLMDSFKRIAKSNIPFDQLIIERNSDGDEWIHISYNPKGGRKQLLQAAYNHLKKKMEFKQITV